MIRAETMFGFEICPTKFKWVMRRPAPPRGFIEYNSKRANCQTGYCPNCKAEKPGTLGGNGGFQDRQIQNLMRSLKRLSDRLHPDCPNWKPFYELFSIDLDPGRQKHSTMLKCHPSRYGTGKFLCCGAEIWHDFFSENGQGWKYYYKPTAMFNRTLNSWI